MERAQSLHQEQQVDRQGQRVEERVRLHPFRHLLVPATVPRAAFLFSFTSNIKDEGTRLRWCRKMPEVTWLVSSEAVGAASMQHACIIWN